MTDVQQLAPAPSSGWRAVTPRGEQAVELVAARPGDTLLATDFDGTLSPIVADPTRARMDPQARTALSALAPLLGRLAVVTGREVSVVRELGELDGTEGFDNLLVLGQYGQESWDAGRGELVVPPAPPAVADALAELQSLLLAGSDEVDLSGVHLEDKGRAIGVHTRRATDPQAAMEWLAGPIAEVAGRHGLVLEPGRNVVELRSSTTSKGDAIEALVGQVDPAVVVMMGDDLGDLPAFAAVRALEERGITGIVVVSGSAEQPEVARHADVLCDGPAGVAQWLHEIVGAVGSAGTGR